MIRLLKTLLLALTLTLAAGCATRRPPPPPPPPAPQPVFPPPPGYLPPPGMVVQPPPGAVIQPPPGAMILPPPSGRPVTAQPFPNAPQAPPPPGAFPTAPAPSFPIATPQPGASLPPTMPPVSSNPQSVPGRSLEGVGYRWQPTVPQPPAVAGTTPYSPPGSPAPSGPAPQSPPTASEPQRASVFLLPPTDEAPKNAANDAPKNTGEPPINSPKIALYPPADSAPPPPYVPPTPADSKPAAPTPVAPTPTAPPPTVPPPTVPPPTAPPPTAPPSPKASSFPVGIANYDRVRPDGNVTTGSRPSLEGLDWLKKEGIATVVFVHLPGAAAVDADRDIVTRRGMTFLDLAFDPKGLDKKSVDEFLRVQRDASLGKIFVYDDVDGSVTGALWYLSFRMIDQSTDEEARVRAGSLGLRVNQDGNFRDMWNAVRAYLDRQ
jgi:hypothetical protein